MRKKTIFTGIGVLGCVLLVFGLMFVYNIRFMPMKITQDAPESLTADAERLGRLREIYDTNFIFDRTSVNIAKIYIPQYTMTEEATGAFYADLFGFGGDGGEFEDYYLYEKGSEKLYVDRYSGYLWYENTADGARIVGEDAVLEKAKSFVYDKFPDFSYETVTVQFEENKYTVQFIENLNGYPNYAFPLTLTYSAGGEMTAMDYYFLSYESIASVNLKPMKEAFHELPVDFDEGTKIDMKDCRTVYIYQESILQPAYLFEGETADGSDFQCFVKAAVYD